MFHICGRIQNLGAKAVQSNDYMETKFEWNHVFDTSDRGQLEISVQSVGYYSAIQSPPERASEPAIGVLSQQSRVFRLEPQACD